ncbi:hypothetical protein ACIBCH_20720 [Amycolatopsis thailandensis]|uniref:hypothetical protein n=1 Tax=Amycolatopsis thailandensis TaxID=589330 RepID=UPI0037BBDB91
MTQPASAAPPHDPNRYRRAVIPIDTDFVKLLLNLPPDMDVHHLFLSPDGYNVMAAVTSPDLPEVHPGHVAPGICPTYDAIDGRAVLVDTGVSSVPGARRWEWAYRYVDHNAPIWHPDQTEADVRRKAAHDLAVIVLRRQPGATEWEEAPA